MRSRLLCGLWDIGPAKIFLARKTSSPRSSGDDSDSGKGERSPRVTISKPGQDFIDEYLETYISLSGNVVGRKRLYGEILATANLRKNFLDSDEWNEKVIAKRLQNSHTKRNKRNAAAADVD